MSVVFGKWTLLRIRTNIEPACRGLENQLRLVPLGSLVHVSYGSQSGPEGRRQPWIIGSAKAQTEGIFLLQGHDAIHLSLLADWWPGKTKRYRRIRLHHVIQKPQLSQKVLGQCLPGVGKNTVRGPLFNVNLHFPND